MLCKDEAVGKQDGGFVQSWLTCDDNTGAGVYKDWPSGDDATIVDITHVAEMRVLHRTKVCSLSHFEAAV